ncbi:MAG: hypothetical protein NC311_11130 [Muribaculaceae bacterium]|nr:hypothetical protein [Muribaculaceae bacterium]
MPLDTAGKKERAKRALEYYLWREAMFLPRPDGEPDRRYDVCVDMLAEQIVALAVRFSESAEWMRWSCEREPPDWLQKFLNERELAGEGPPRAKPNPEPIPEELLDPKPLKPPPKKRGGRRKKEWMTEEMRDPNSEEFIGLRKEHIDLLIEHYDEIPPIDPETGKPPGWICDL